MVTQIVSAPSLKVGAFNPERKADLTASNLLNVGEKAVYADGLEVSGYLDGKIFQQEIKDGSIKLKSETGETVNRTIAVA